MIIIHATFHVNPSMQDQFLEQIQPLIASSREEAGNITYSLKKDVESENVFTMVEVWQDQAAVASHNSSNHFTTFVANAKQFLTAPLQVQAFEGQALK